MKQMKRVLQTVLMASLILTLGREGVLAEVLPDEAIMEGPVLEEGAEPEVVLADFLEQKELAEDFEEERNEGPSFSEDENGNFSEEPIEALEAVVTPDSDFEWDGNEIIKYIGSGTDVIVPKRATKIRNGAFRENGTITSLSFEESSTCTEIAANAFRDCKKLVTVTLPGKLVTIGGFAFESCDIREITLPLKLQNLGFDSFTNNKNLTKVTVNSVALEKAEEKCFANDPITEISFGDSMTSVPGDLFHYADLSNAEIVLPARITEIKGGAFYGAGLKSITFTGNALKTIGANAFITDPLTSIVLPSSVESIGDYAFSECALTEITLPGGIKDVGYHAFAENHSLKTVNYNIPEVESWGQWVFTGDNMIETVNIGSNVKIIPYQFMDKVDLSRVELKIPSSVTTIGDYAFSRTNLSSVEFSGSSLTTIGCAFDQCAFQILSLPHSVTEIGANALSGNSHLIKTVVPKNLKTLENGTFASDDGLEQVAIYKDTKINGDPFSGCSTAFLVLYGYAGSPAEKYAQSNGYTFRSIDTWEGGNPYGVAGGDVTGLVIIPDAGETGLDSAVSLVKTDSNRYTAQMVKGQKDTFGKGSWKSDTPSVVSVVKNTGAVTAKKAGTAVLTEEKTGAVVTVTVFQPVLSVKKMTCYVFGENGKVSLSGLSESLMEVTWVSSNYEVVSVEGEGPEATIIPRGKGSAQVSAYVGGQVYPIKVTVTDVYPATKLKNEDQISLNVFQSAALSFESGFKPAKAKWTEEGGAELGADSVVLVKGSKIQANHPGEITIIGTNEASSVKLTVSVQAIPTKSVLYVNRGTQKSYQNTYAKGNTVQWRATEGLKLINTTGTSVKLSGENAGTETLTCSYNGLEYETEVIIEDPVPAESTITLAEGSQGSLALSSLTHPVVFKSSKKTVAFADTDGTIYARKKGTAVISATINGKRISVKVVVGS